MPNTRPLSQWPKLLIGPILRRVTMSQASVFIGTKMACQASIKIYQGRQASGAGTVLASSAPVTLTRIGENLFVAVLSVTIPAGQSEGATLSYDIEIVENGGAPQTLNSLGLLGGSAATDKRRKDFPLGYDVGQLPSFLLPPKTVDQLRLVHGSCRKPHGGGANEADAMNLLDLAIGQAISGGAAANTRPHQLVLTGDQIYADDVAPALLSVLTETGDTLLGWRETLPAIPQDMEFLTNPGWRTRYLAMPDVDIKATAPDDALDYSQSHLLRFGEWVAMYIFAWSDALWPATTSGDYDLPGQPLAVPVQKIIDKAVTLGLMKKPPQSANFALGLVTWLSKFSERIAEHWKKTRPEALRYAKTVRLTARALANCPTYMMFDDHEITDDWNVSKRVHDRLKGNGRSDAKGEVGPRLLRNGLSAYAIFQHWGNVPEDFAPGTKGKHLLDMWSYTGSAGCLLTANTRVADTILGLLPGDSPIPPLSNPSRQDFQRMRWDYAIAFPAHRLVSLDTRTWRFFPTGQPFSWSDLAAVAPSAADIARRSDIAQLGGDLIQKQATAWQTAAAQVTAPAMGHYAQLLQTYADLAGAGTETVIPLRKRLLTIVVQVEALRQSLPKRAVLPATAIDDPDLHYAGKVTVNLGMTAPDLTALSNFINAGMGSTPEELKTGILSLLHQIPTLDLGPKATDLTATLEAAADFVEAAWAKSEVAMVHSALRVIDRGGSQLWSVLSTISATGTIFGNFATAAASNLTQAMQLAATRGVSLFSEKLFRSGANRLAPGLIRDDALAFIVSRPLQSVGTADHVTFFLSPAPIFGNRLVEFAQRAAVTKLVAQGKAGEEEMDYEPWSGNIPSMMQFFEAAASLDCAIVLSGDVHYAGSTVYRVTGKKMSTRYIQLTSSSTRNSDSATRKAGLVDDIAYDTHGNLVFLQADWTALLDKSNPAFPLLANYARVAIGEKLDAINPVAITKAKWSEFKVWCKEPLDLAAIQTTALRILAAPVNTFRNGSNEAMWQVNASIENLKAYLDDPIQAVFGDFLSAPDVMRQQLTGFFDMVGLIDLGSGLRMEGGVVLRDHRSPRLPLYPVINTRLTVRGKTEKKMVEDLQRRTVGHANLGFVQIYCRGGEVTEVHHELRWYPIDSPPGETDPKPRTDYIGTLHRAGWHGNALAPTGAIR